MKRFLQSFQFTSEVAQALEEGHPVVALESTVITHGLPYPENLQIAQEMENEVRRSKAVPATIALLDGQVHVGVKPEELERLAQSGQAAGFAPMRKISRREFGPALALGWSGGTTVAGTMIAAHTAGIRVFATGGIGGVHRGATHDISADLPELGRTQVIVVCAGAKAILDLDATLEYLETAAVPVVGYRTGEFPAFFSINSDLPVGVRAESALEIAQIAHAHWSLPGAGGMLVVNPPPVETALARAEVDRAVNAAVAEAESRGVRGQEVTPFLLGRVNELTGGASLKANLALLKSNAQLAAQIAVQVSQIDPPG